MNDISPNFYELVTKIEEWGHDRNLIEGSDPKSQLLKTMAELGELADGINKNDMPEIIDGIGDVAVTLILICKQYDIDFDYCLFKAYDEIKDRKGKMINGTFVKDL